ncbi:TOBE domain-containing protein [Streptomyces sp. NPDC050085]|uniref:TOBE domain-containing protein n=1 Tax=Streptomyces sp. NPDC050085 TaxID=3365600 RepID=UPI0037A330AB
MRKARRHHRGLRQGLGLAAGSTVRALVKSTKSTEVALAAAPLEALFLRNQLPGTVTDVTTGGAMAAVGIAVAGAEPTAAVTREAVTREAVTDLGLAPGSRGVALMKSTEVALPAA